jgi:RNA recognition motif-containing protein
MPVRLFVGNLPYETTEPDLREFFSSVGPLSNVIIPVDRETGKRRGFAFVEFSDPAQAQEASRRLNNQPFKGRNITINEARARENRPDAGSGPRPSSFMRPAGVGSSPRPFSPRPAFNNAEFQNPLENGKAGRTERRSRNFGPDAKPARKRKSNFGSKAGGGEMGWKKGPIRERTSGQFFGGYDEDASGDVFEDEDLENIAQSTESDEEGAV